MKSFYYYNFPGSVNTETLLNNFNCKIGDVIRIIKPNNHCDYYILKEEGLVKMRRDGYSVSCPHCREMFG